MQEVTIELRTCNKSSLIDFNDSPYPSIDMTDGTASMLDAKASAPASTADKLDAAMNRANVLDKMQSITYALEHLGILKSDQSDRLIDTIKRFKHGV